MSDENERRRKFLKEDPRIGAALQKLMGDIIPIAARVGTHPDFIMLWACAKVIYSMRMRRGPEEALEYLMSYLEAHSMMDEAGDGRNIIVDGAKINEKIS